MARELTKRFEEVRQGTLAELAEGCATDPPRGEIVVLIDRPGDDPLSEDALDSRLIAALAQHSLRDAVDRVAAETGLPRKSVYRKALTLKS